MQGAEVVTNRWSENDQGKDIGRIQLIYIWRVLKGVFSKPSGKRIVSPNLWFFELETSNFGYLHIF